VLSHVAYVNGYSNAMLSHIFSASEVI